MERKNKKDLLHLQVPENAGTQSTMGNLPFNMLEGFWALPRFQHDKKSS